MPTLHFIGGEDVQQAESLSMHRSVFRDCVGARVLMLPWTSPPTERSRSLAELCRGIFLGYGAERVELAGSDSPPARLSQQFAEADLLYLPGGDPRLLVRNIRKLSLCSEIQAFPGIVVGNSAGAVVMARRMVFLRGQGGEPCASLTDGLALADVAVSVHYGAADPAFAGSHPDEDLAALSMGQGIEILAIPEASVVIIKEDSVSCRGQVFAFRGESRHTLEGPDGAQTTDRTGAWT